MALQGGGGNIKKSGSGSNGIATLLGNQAALNAATNPVMKNNGTPYTPNVSLAPPKPAASSAGSAGASRSSGGYSLSSPITSNQYSATGMTGDGTATDTPATPAAPAQTQEQYLAGDSTYQGALAALKKTLAGYQADNDQNLAKYDTNYNTGLQNLGWQGDGQWNQDDTNTAYGRSFNNQLNDFGARDMLTSSFYGDALNNMLRQFNDQKTQLDTSRTDYRDDQASQLAQEQNQNTTAQQQALAEAIARRAAGVSTS